MVHGTLFFLCPLCLGHIIDAQALGLPRQTLMVTLHPPRPWRPEVHAVLTKDPTYIVVKLSKANLTPTTVKSQEEVQKPWEAPRLGLHGGLGGAGSGKENLGNSHRACHLTSFPLRNDCRAWAAFNLKRAPIGSKSVYLCPVSSCPGVGRWACWTQHRLWSERHWGLCLKFLFPSQREKGGYLHPHRGRSVRCERSRRS